MEIYLICKLLLLKINSHFFTNRTGASHSSISLAEAQTIGVLYSYETPDKHDIVQRFIRDFKNLGKKVSALCYTKQSDRSHASSNLLYAFGHEDITLLGHIKSERVIKFIESDFDYLFHFDVRKNTILDYIIARSYAKCRVGYFDPMRTNLFEVMVKIKTTNEVADIKRLGQQMIYYTGSMAR